MNVKIVLLMLALLTGHASAQSNTAYNQGVRSFQENDYLNARLHWKKATEERVRAAHNNLGYLLYFGLGGAPEPERAVSLWDIAARSGDREAQWHLAQAFETGRGVELNLVTAYAWYRCADVNFEAAPLADQADLNAVKDAKAAILRIAAKLSDGEVRNSERLAKECIAAFPYSTRWLVPMQIE